MDRNWLRFAVCWSPGCEGDGRWWPANQPPTGPLRWVIAQAAAAPPRPPPLAIIKKPPLDLPGTFCSAFSTHFNYFPLIWLLLLLLLLSSSSSRSRGEVVMVVVAGVCPKTSNASEVHNVFIRVEIVNLALLGQCSAMSAILGGLPLYFLLLLLFFYPFSFTGSNNSGKPPQNSGKFPILFKIKSCNLFLPKNYLMINHKIAQIFLIQRKEFSFRNSFLFFFFEIKYYKILF